MKRKFFYLFIILIIGTTSKISAWSILNCGTTIPLNDICFVNINTGFVVGHNGTILKTTNAGKTWFTQNSGTTDILRAVFFVDSLVGYAVGGTTSTSVILKTTDGGLNWVVENSGTTKGLYDVSFTSADTGYAVGYQGVIVKTTDGGTNWNSIPNVSNLQWNSVHFFNGSTGIVVGKSGKIIKTTDGGINWTTIPATIGTSSILWNIQFINSQTGYIAGWTGCGLLKSTDGGNTWNSINTNSIGNAFSAVFFINDTVGYVTGNGISKTTDGGLNWTKQYNAEQIGGTSLFFLNEQIGYAVGGSSSSGAVILKTSIGGGYKNFDYTDGNNIKARFDIGGSMFWDMIDNAEFEIPKGSGHKSIFASSIWMGGKDQAGQIHLFGDRYHSHGFDLFPGPVMDNNYAEDEENWIRFWKINRGEIENHIANWATPGYQMPVSISEWPGNGDVSKGQASVLAPYFDYNNDGLYTPQNGDYPIIKGDDAMYFIMNDSARIHTETAGRKMGVEIHAMAYSFNCPGDSALWNTLFLNYEIINKSQNTYDSTFFGFFSDFDLGDPTDDYVGCDVSRSSFYVYNGDAIDGDGSGNTYGSHPPAQSVTFLGGPNMDADGSDFGSSGIPDGCDESINGLGFNDSIIDNERLGMSSFIYFNNSLGGSGDPYSGPEYYYYLNGRWRDGTHMTYGGNGHLSGSTTCKFMFPDNSDSCGWGTDGIPQPVWNENTSSNPPYDRRGVGSMGPFTLLPGSVHNVDIAFVFGRDFSDPSPWAGVVNMQQRIDSVRKYFNQGQTPCGSFSIGVKENKLSTNKFEIYPNPAQDHFDIKCENVDDLKNVKIYSIEGTLVKEETFAGDQTRISTSKMSNGLYVVEIISRNTSICKKLIITK